MNNIGRNDPCYCGSGKKYKQCCAQRQSMAAPGGAGGLSGVAGIPHALQAALEYHQAGRFAQAEPIYRQVLALDPGNADALHLSGVLHHQTGRHAEAAGLIGQALTLQPEYAEAHANLGEAWRAMGQHDNAVACYSQALALKPGYAQAHYNLGLSLHAQGKLDAAVASFQQALTFMPEYPDALLALGRLLQGQGELKKALLCCQRLLKIQPGMARNWSLYASILELLSDEALNLVDPELLLHAFSQQVLDPQKLERLATAMVCADPLAQGFLLVAADAENGRTQIEAAVADGSLQPLLAMPLLLALLEQALITDYRLERLLALVRQALLAALLRTPQAEAAPVVERFACGLALQCFANEYIYTITAVEEAHIAALTDHLEAAFGQSQPVPAIMLALAGCYQPLYRQPFAAWIKPADWAQAHVQALLERQLGQPLQEDALKAEIPGLTGVADAVSQAVRQQYEENPYPRWKRRGVAGVGLPLDEALRQRLPHRDITAQLPAAPDILVAGCGTGSDAFQVAQSFAHAGILAVDISKTSLAYAMRATREFGVTDIDFRHGDILELGALERRFDLIVCSGVLHHMRDPLAGWRVLTGLLRPDGYMNIGLYSRRARREVSALRQLVAEKDYPATREGISRFRRDVMQGEAGIDIGVIAISPDFYSTSACRDLIFHVQEHVYSPLEIRDCLDALGLEFLGFEFSNPETRNRYLARFPDNPACDSLANWDTVEEENPAIFAGMYQFWVRKRT
ncbi:tetratricopeptide repeat protein [Janthinobacterium sp. 17J80-10]|uniref:tetratricopeptide repeat protein n=1 Tax=Janthinobacterium sp. 17J80-10 TaxID=2497863 RepID=UPI00100531FD|nr:tetratricopeptide repeat protein [Janthinobacterium sp. 17J80-10]QAU35764.1 tetratricopeptide repeat protein [Janthinobacterium sp. 17J80-10]